jgi:hypothetical protein
VFGSHNLSSCVLSLTANRTPMNANSMADVRIWVNMIGETAESINFTILEHRKLFVFVHLYPHNVHISVHPNELIASLTEPPIQRRLRRYWLHDLLVRF